MYSLLMRPRILAIGAFHRSLFLIQNNLAIFHLQTATQSPVSIFLQAVLKLQTNLQWKYFSSQILVSYRGLSGDKCLKHRVAEETAELVEFFLPSPALGCHKFWRLKCIWA